MFLLFLDQQTGKGASTPAVHLFGVDAPAIDKHLWVCLCATKYSTF